MEMWKFGVTGFKVGKTIEGAFDEAAEKLKALAAQPPAPRPDPEMAKVQAQQQMDQARLQHDQQVAQQQASLQQAEAQATAQREAMNAERDAALETQKQQHEAALKERELQMQCDFDRWKAELEADTKIIVAEIAAASKPEPSEAGAEGAASKPKRQSPLKVIAQAQADFMEKIDAQGAQLQQAQQEMAEHMRKMADDSGAPIVGTRGPDGRIGMVQKGARKMRVMRGPDGVSLMPEGMQ